MAAIIVKPEALVARLRADLLAWYDRHGRDLAWRRGVRDAYRVWLSEVMLQQTTVPHATPYYEKFLTLWPGVRDLAAADDGAVMAEWAGLGYYARARRLLACARVLVQKHDGVFPADEAALLALPGFGPYTAAAVAAIAFGHAANVVDGNIERVMTRLYAIATPLPAAKALVREAAAAWLSTDRAGDWPQALMDLASLICKPKAPLCDQCPLRAGCLAFQGGEPDAYPVKLAKKAKPRRYGVVFVITSADAVIVERRPDKGLLGGMLGLPHTPWRETPWKPSEVEAFGLSFSPAGHYEHVFTHFALTQEVWLARLSREAAQILSRQHNDWQWLPLAEQRSLPTVFRKALRGEQGELDRGLLL